MSTTTNMQDLVDRLDATREDEVLAVADQLYQVPWNHTGKKEKLREEEEETASRGRRRTSMENKCTSHLLHSIVGRGGQGSGGAVCREDTTHWRQF